MTQQFPGSEFPNIPGDPLILEPLQKSLLAMTYGVHIIGSTSMKNEHNLMIADWVMQVSFQPRLVAVSIENDARTLRFIQETKSFTVNLLHQLDGIDLARAVVMPSEGKKIKGRSVSFSEKVHNKLDGLDHTFAKNGSPILNNALAWYACDVQQLIPAGDHTLVIGEAIDGALLRSGDALTEKELGWEYGG